MKSDSIECQKKPEFITWITGLIAVFLVILIQIQTAVAGFLNQQFYFSLLFTGTMFLCLSLSIKSLRKGKTKDFSTFAYNTRIFRRSIGLGLGNCCLIATQKFLSIQLQYE